MSASLAAVQMLRYVGGGNVALPVVMDRAGSIVGVSVACNAARTAGTATFTVYLNGLTTGFSVVLDDTNTNNFSNTQASGADAFAASSARLVTPATNDRSIFRPSTLKRLTWSRPL